MAANDKPYILHTNYLSTCSGRLRIALNLKGIPYDAVYVDTKKGEHKSEAYSRLNPSNTIPCLQNHDRSVVITQSLAAIEYLDEQESDSPPQLLPPPSNPAARAAVRSLAYIIAVDVQPTTSSRIRTRIEALGGESESWCIDTFLYGLKSYERHVQSTAGDYSYGNSITMADVCLMPAVWKALNFGIDVETLFPTIWRISRKLSEEDAVKVSHSNAQPDCPDELRG